MEIEKRRKMDSFTFTEDIWTVILARLPIKSMTTSKLVCKQWKSIIESPFLRELFLAHHQNSHSSWSLMLRNHSPKEVVAHYGCKVWGLQRSLGSYVSSLITAKFHNQNVRVLAYTEVGLILICVITSSNPWTRIPTYYVANPVSGQCVKIPPLPESFHSSHAGLVTRTENGVVLSYKVVLIDTPSKDSNSHLLERKCLNGSLHWLGRSLDGQEVVVSIDLYGSCDHPYRVIPFPDSEKKMNFKRSCTTSQGNLMYMNIASIYNYDEGAMEHKLKVWRLKIGEWQLVSETSPGLSGNYLDYSPLFVHPFDGNTMYMWSEMYKTLASINLRSGKSTVYNELERSRNGQTLSSVGCKRKFLVLSASFFWMFVLPRWLYRIPCTSEVAEKTSSGKNLKMKITT
ncbi:F-box protein At3g28330 [Eutrema salsugineum]|uniref:F-box protein At3g28330 n=1 Tax=Eutrema salsugineum TaxID=72664 RepID=UPI000CED607C|nr:F-box protein At3g28330 [Eutrema salsugineum]